MNDSPPFKHEEQAFRFYARALSSSGVSGSDPIAMRGRDYAEKCPNCGSDRWVGEQEAQRCGGFRCGRPRPWKLIGVTKGFFSENVRRHSGDRRLERIAELGMAFQCLKLWELRVWWSYCALGSYQRTFHFCRQTWPRRVEGWSLLRVKRIIEEARDRSRPELEKRGLI